MVAGVALIIIIMAVIIVKNDKKIKELSKKIVSLSYPKKTTKDTFTPTTSKEQ